MDAAVSGATVEDTAPSIRKLPGEEGVWVLIFGDMVVFSVFFITFFVYRADAVEVFRAGRETLNIGLGIVNTMLLLTSSLFVAMAIRDVRRNGMHAAPLIASAATCGVGFCAVKAVEYTTEIQAGHTLNSSDFFIFYFMYTGIHLVHVLIGIGVLTAMYLHCRRAGVGLKTMALLESGASFWHLVDLLWIILFPLFYLIR